MSTSSMPNDPQPGNLPPIAGVTLKDPSARMFVLTRFIDVLEKFERDDVDKLNEQGVTPELIDKLRKLSMSDAWHVTQRNCGLSVSIDPAVFGAELNRLQLVKQSQAVFEYFVKHGATAPMLTRLFNETPTRIRQMSSLLGPSEAGRPRMPPDDVRTRIAADWAEICAAIAPTEPNHERRRFMALHERWPNYLFRALDAVVNSREMEPYVPTVRGARASTHAPGSMSHAQRKQFQNTYGGKAR